MTKENTIKLLRLINSGITEPDELHNHCPFFNEDELLYLTRCAEPLLILDGNYLSIHENGYNLLYEADNQELLLSIAKESNSIAMRAESKADNAASENRRLNYIVIAISFASLLIAILAWIFPR